MHTYKGSFFLMIVPQFLFHLCAKKKPYIHNMYINKEIVESCSLLSYQRRTPDNVKRKEMENQRKVTTNKLPAVTKGTNRK